MKHWRRAVLAVLVTGSMGLGGPALGNGQSGDHRQDGDRPSQPTAPPETDPTCSDSGDCPGDNGGDDGAADENVPCTSDGTELARDILFGGSDDGSCPE